MTDRATPEGGELPDDETPAKGPSHWVPKEGLSGFLVTGTAWAFASRLIALVAGIASQAFLARLIPPESLGTYFLTQSFVIIASNVGELGLNRPVARMVSADVGQGRSGPALKVLWSAVEISAISAFVVLVFVVAGPGSWLASHVFESQAMADSVALIGLWVFGRIVLDIGASALQGLHRVGISSFLSGTLAPTLIAVVCGALLLTNADMDFDDVVVVAAFATIGSGLVCVLILARPFAGVRASGPSRRAELMASTLPIFAAGVLQVGAAQADIWIVAAQFNPEEVALYGAAQRLTTLVGFPVLVLTAVVPPMMADLYARDERKRLEGLLRAATAAVCVPMLAGLGIFLLFGSQILTLAYGELYAAAVPLLQILCLERFVFTFLGTGSLLLVMTGHEGAVLRITLVSSLFSFLALYLGGRLGGTVGVAVGVAISSSAMAIWYFIEAYRRTGIWVHANPMAMGPMMEVIRRMARARS